MWHIPLPSYTGKVLVLACLVSAKRSGAEVRSVSRVYHSACLERGQSYWDYENFQLNSVDWEDVDRYEVTGRLGFGRFSEVRDKEVVWVSSQGKIHGAVYCTVYCSVMGRDILCTVTPAGTLPGSNRYRPRRGVYIEDCRVQSFRALDTRAQDLRCGVNDSPILLRYRVMFRTDSGSEYSCCYRTFLRTVVATQHDGQRGRISIHSITYSRGHRSEGISSARFAS